MVFSWTARRQVVRDWVEDKLHEPLVKRALKHWKTLAAVVGGIFLFFFFDAHRFLWLRHGEMYSADSKCPLPLVTKLLPPHPLHSISHDEAENINTCYLTHYNLSCIHPHVYNAAADVISWKVNGVITHHRELGDLDWTFDNFIAGMFDNTFFPQRTRNATLAKLASAKSPSTALHFTNFHAMCIHAMLRPASFAAPFLSP